MANPLYSMPWLKEAGAKFSRYFNTASFGGFAPVNPYNGLVTNQPTDGYKVVNIDQAAASPQYFGFVTPDAGDPTSNYGWYIMKAVVSGGVTSYTFATWDNGTGVAVNGVQYRTATTGAWDTRAALTYANYEDVF